MTMPLDGVRVLDLTRYTAGPFCTRVLGDYGANVIKIEPPSGDPARGLPPFMGDEPGPERSGLFLFLNTNKRSVVLDLKNAAGRERFLQLVQTADVVVENFRPGVMERLGLGYGRLEAENPRIVLTSISNFGQNGPYRDWQGTDLTLYAMGGPMIAAGDAGHEPVKVAGHWPGYYAGYAAALATAVALRGATLRGVGEHVDLSIFEAHAHSVDMRLMNVLLYQYTGRPSARGTKVSGKPGEGIFPCSDGFVFLASGGHPGHIGGILRMIGREDLLALPEWSSASAARTADQVDEFNAHLILWLLEQPKTEVRRACQRNGVLGAPMNTIADAMVDENYVARRFFQTIDHPSTGPLVYPGYGFKLHREEGPMPARRRAPLLGEHTAEVLGELAVARTVAATATTRASVLAGAGGGLPLAGVRVLDLTLVFAGPYGTLNLVDWGAEVIRVESLQHFQPITRGTIARPTREMVQTGRAVAWYPEDDPGERPWNRAANFNGHARGKKSMTLDLTRPEGWAVFEELVRSADGVYENNMPGHMEKLGVTWERLSQINPRLIMLRVPAFGLEGPYRDYRTLGYHMEAIAGHPPIRAYPDVELDYAPVGVAADAASGIGGALGFVLGLQYRERTGRGVLVELATAENIMPLLGEFVMDYEMNGRLWQQMANEHVSLAPHNVYRCSGGDRWVAIACRSEGDWQQLCEILKRPDLAADARFGTMAQRHANRRALDPLIAEWTEQREAHWVMERLQEAGIAAGVVMNEPDLLGDRQLAARAFFQEIDSPETGRQRYAARAWRASRSPQQRLRHPVRLGEDNDYVYRELLGFNEAEYRRFEELGHIGTAFDPSIP